jgi:hypothetical protein
MRSSRKGARSISRSDSSEPAPSLFRNCCEPGGGRAPLQPDQWLYFHGVSPDASWTGGSLAKREWRYRGRPSAEGGVS